MAAADITESNKAGYCALLDAKTGYTGARRGRRPPGPGGPAARPQAYTKKLAKQQRHQRRLAMAWRTRPTRTATSTR